MSRDKDTTPSRDALKRLERELEAERKASAELRAGVRNLQRTVAELRAEFSAQLRDAEAKLRGRGGTGNGHDAPGDELARLRDELARVSSERDTLQQRLVRVEGMQTETVTLPDDEPEPAPHKDDAPSIDELMASLSEMMEDTSHSRRQPAFEETAAEPDWQEMLPAELILPDEFKKDETAPEEQDSAAPRAAIHSARLLVRVDAGQPIKYPLYKQVTTIGRSDDADIQIDGNFISRIHARVICGDNEVEIEDAGSKNGIKVNSKQVKRAALAHGDVLGIAALRFTYLETPES